MITINLVKRFIKSLSSVLLPKLQDVAIKIVLYLFRIQMERSNETKEQ